MRKVTVTCPCGQRMQVSRAAYGKIGICPKCNQKIRVGAGGVEQLSLPAPDMAPPPPPFHDAPRLEARADSKFEAAKRKFGQAVDLFYRRRYAEAAASLDDLLKELPANSQVETARKRCLEAMERAEAASAPEPTVKVKKPAEPESKPEPPRQPEKARPPAVEELTVGAVHRAVLYLLREGSPDSVRLDAAELACRMLGIADAAAKAVKIAPANGNGNGKRGMKPIAEPDAATARTTTD